MFNLHDFVIKTLSTMKNRLDEYQVRAYALSWYSKSVLTDDDMLTIDSWYTVVETETTNEDTENSNGDFEEVTTDTEKEN
nr:MAG TPA: hypothetical protein [Caudoviricetes sp.]